MTGFHSHAGGPDIAALAGMSVDGLLSMRARLSPAGVAFRQHDADGSTLDLRWTDLATLADAFASSLLSLGIEHGDRVAVWCQPGAEPLVAALGCQLIGCIPVGLHMTASGDEVRAILALCRPAMILADDSEAVMRIFGGTLPEGILALCGLRGAEMADRRPPALRVDWTTLLALGLDVPEKQLAARKARTTSDDVATVVYTSGTTGAPKGVMLSWRGMALSLCGIFGRDALRQPPGVDDRTVHEVGMATPTGMWFGLVYPLIYGCTAHIPGAGQDPVEFRRAAQPTVFYGRPAIWIETARTIVERSRQWPFPRRIGYALLMRTGRQLLRRKTAGAGAMAAVLDRLHGMLVKMVVGKELRSFGLNATRYAFCGGAPLAPPLIEQWFCWGVAIRTFYGMTECSGVATIVTDSVPRVGAVGKAGRFAELRQAPDGEILIGGPILFKGYLDRPDLTERAIDRDGFFATGDLGEVLDDGSLIMLDRKINVLRLRDGTAVIASRIESLLRSNPIVAFAMIVGNGRDRLCALIELNAGEVSRKLGDSAIHTEGPSGLDRNAAVRRFVEDHLAECTRQGKEAGLPGVADFLLLPEALTPADSEIMTPTGKVRRANLERRYAPQIEDLYRRLDAGAAAKSNLVVS